MPVLVALGESALVVQWNNRIDRGINQQVNALAAALRAKPFFGMIDSVTAYSSLTVRYDPVVIRTAAENFDTANDFVNNYITSLLEHPININEQATNVVEIPVCYDISLGNDMALISEFAGLEKAAVIDLHRNETYYVYMPGFLPGFVYMGDVNERIAIPRKQKPVAVKAGAVGIAGRQTGIYPVDSPGGWHIVGYTPIQMFDPQSASPCVLKPGARVKFYAIDIADYHALKNVNEG